MTPNSDSEIPGGGLPRRQFIKYLGGAATIAMTPSALRGSASVIFAGSASPTREQVEKTIAPWLQCDDPEMWRLAVDIYHQCILGKIRAAEPPLNHAWLTPGGQFIGQWLWDTMFVVDLLSILPDQKETIRGVFQNYWDFQDRWDAANPEYAHGMVSNSMVPESAGGVSRPYSQAPLLAWGMERVFKRNGDLELVRAGISRLEKFHEWYWRERDVTRSGLIAVGSYSAATQDARYETYDYELDLDGLKMTAHPTLNRVGHWYGDICIPANTAYLLLSEESLARLAEAAGDVDMAGRRRDRRRHGIAAMREHMWDQESGCFLAVNRDTLKKIPAATIGGFVALMAGIPTETQAARMAGVLAGDGWITPLPIPTVNRNDPRYQSNKPWRGDVWPTPNYQVASGLTMFGHKKQASQIVDVTIDNVIRNGINERYDSLSGKSLGVSGLGMSCAVLTMVMDGLSAKRKISVKAQQHVGGDAIFGELAPARKRFPFHIPSG